jgi:hypothetical protein
MFPAAEWLFIAILFICDFLIISIYCNLGNFEDEKFT